MDGVSASKNTGATDSIECLKNRRQLATSEGKHHESHHGYYDGADRGGYAARLRGAGQVSRLLSGGVVSMSISVEWNKQEMAKMLDNQKVKETVNEQVDKLLRFADTPITTLEEPTIEARCETRIVYSERLGEASKSISIESIMTFGELLTLCRSLLGADNDSA